MSQERQNELQEQTKQLLDGPLKHVRAAALAAVLLPLASVAATPASAQIAQCGSGGLCGFVFNDANNNGIQDAGESGIAGASVTLVGPTPQESVVTFTGPDGFYYFGFLPFPGTGPDMNTYVIEVQTPNGTEPSPANVGSNDALDSDGVSDGLGNSVASVTLVGVADSNTDFGFHQLPVTAPGTGTPGYWKNHPDAWPVPGLTVGGVYYTRDQAIAWLDMVGKDKTTTMFSSLVSAKLNLLVGNNPACVATTITAADNWMATYGPVGRGVAASSYAWKVGEPLHRLMDNYNNGMLCAPHRD
jgi:SdrD B-like domain